MVRGADGTSVQVPVEVMPLEGKQNHIWQSLASLTKEHEYYPRNHWFSNILVSESLSTSKNY